MTNEQADQVRADLLHAREILSDIQTHVTELRAERAAIKCATEEECVRADDLDAEIAEQLRRAGEYSLTVCDLAFDLEERPVQLPARVLAEMLEALTARGSHSAGVFQLAHASNEDHFLTLYNLPPCFRSWIVERTGNDYDLTEYNDTDRAYDAFNTLVQERNLTQ